MKFAILSRIAFSCILLSQVSCGPCEEFYTHRKYPDQRAENYFNNGDQELMFKNSASTGLNAEETG